MSDVEPNTPKRRPAWKRPVGWLFFGAALATLLAVTVIEETTRPPTISYGAFLDQLDAGSVSTVTFDGTESTGRLRHDLASNKTGTGSLFRSRMPDFGDPTLIPELPRQHVGIEVASSWTRWLAGLPLPMLIVVGAMLLAGLARLIRRRHPATREAASLRGMPGMISLVATLFGTKRTAVARTRTSHRKRDT